MRISDWSSDVCSSDLIGREEKADRASDRGAEARGIAKRHQGQIDAALHVIDPGPVEAVAVAAHRERVRKSAHRVAGVDMGDDEDAVTALVRAGVKHSAIAEYAEAREAHDRPRVTGDCFEKHVLPTTEERSVWKAVISKGK